MGPSFWLCKLSLASSPSVVGKKKLPTAKPFPKAFLYGLKYFKSSDTSVTWSFQAILSWKKIINHKATLYAKPYLAWLHWDRSLRLRKYCSVEGVPRALLGWLQGYNMHTAVVQLRLGWVSSCSTSQLPCVPEPSCLCYVHALFLATKNPKPSQLTLACGKWPSTQPSERIHKEGKVK